MPSGPQALAAANITAIDIALQVSREGRLATVQERRMLERFRGWGGLPGIFDESKPEWTEARDRLRGLLTERQWASARQTTLNAHYTSPDIAGEMWTALQGLGFAGGRVLEPGCGRGVFMSAVPDEVRATTKVTGIELDEVTALVARALHPADEIRNEGFEASPFKAGTFQAAIGNVPFGSFVVHDPIWNKDRHPIHDAFILKSLGLVEEGGIVCLLTSRYTMDKQSDSCRKSIAEIGYFLGAVRLPEGTFRGSAGTDVVTDILVLRKRRHGEPTTGQGEDWTQTVERDINGAKVHVNEYFAKHREQILGDETTARGMYREGEYTVKRNPALLFDDALHASLNDIVQSAKAKGLVSAPDVTTPIEAPIPPPAAPPTMAAPTEQAPHVKDGALYVTSDGELRRRGLGGSIESHGLPDNAVRSTKLLVRMRDAALEILRLQADDTEGEPWLAAQQRLNADYDVFKSEFGAINKVVKRQLKSADEDGERYAKSYPNHKHVKSDPDFGLICSLERYDDETDTAYKTDIFAKRVLSPKKTVNECASVKDALYVTLDETGGKVDIDRIAELTKKTAQDAEAELVAADLVFRTPIKRQLVTADEYLAGRVRLKLRQAEKVVADFPEFQRNVDALRKVQPEDLAPSQIDVRLGSSWVPPQVVGQFVDHLLDIYRTEVAFVEADAAWSVRVPFYVKNNNLKATVEFGTGRRSAVDLIQDCLSQKLSEVYDTDSDGKRTRNDTETLVAREKQELIQSEFAKWIWSDDDRAARLCELYNRKFNDLRLRHFDGTHLTFPGMSPSISFRQHQKDVVFRVLSAGNTLAAHEVGAGKTYTGCACAVELRRTGLAKKPMLVVPNHMLEQWTREFKQLYPAAKLLVADKESLQGDNRREFVARCATGDWDCVLITHSAFGKIRMSAEFERQHIESQLDQLRELLEKEKGRDGKRLTVKELEKSIRRREEKVRKLMAVEKKDNTSVTFESLGVDWLCVDESHLFKNLDTPTRIQGITGAASQRASDLFMKLRYLEERTPGRSALFLTGTPVSNSLGELFIIQKYLQFEELERKGLGHFDAWVGSFARTVTQLELAPDGNSWRMNTRFAKFVNMPELLNMFRTFADVRTADMLKLPIPSLKGGKPQVIDVPASPELEEFIRQLGERAERCKSRRVDPKTDNMLKITGDGRRAATMPELVGIDVAEGTPTKVGAVAIQVAELYHKHKNDEYATADGTAHPILGSLQTVFCDVSTPSSGKLNAYDAIKDGLLARGVPADKIRYIHDFPSDEDKARLFADCRAGKVAVLFGSTEKLGTGTNIQHRMVALHHVDCPYRPSDLTQRTGRLLRQGNQNSEVEEFIYVTTGSFDTYSWQTVQRKQGFISQIMSGRLNGRECEDIDEKQMTFAQVKAICSGDPRVLEQAELDSEYAKLRRLKDAHDQSLWRVKSMRRNALATAERLERDVYDIERSIRQRRDISGDNFTASVSYQRMTERKVFGEAVLARVLEECDRKLEAHEKENGRSIVLGGVGGFNLKTRSGGYVPKGRVEVYLDSPFPLTVQVVTDASEVGPIGFVQSIAFKLNSFEQILDGHRHRIVEMEQEAAAAEAKLKEMEFPHEARFQEIARRREELDALLRQTAAETVAIEAAADDTSPKPVEQPGDAIVVEVAPAASPDTLKASWKLVLSGAVERLSSEQTRERVRREAEDYARANGMTMPSAAVIAAVNNAHTVTAGMTP